MRTSRRWRLVLLGGAFALASSGACEDREIRLRGGAALTTCDGEQSCPDGTTCDARTATCVECLADADCSSERRAFCVAGECSECRADSDCNEWDPYCDATDHRCVECRSAADCDEWDPVCTTRGECVECLSDRDCLGDAWCDGDQHECRTS